MEATPGAVPGSYPNSNEDQFGELSEINLKSNHSILGAQDVLTSPFNNKEVKHHLKDLKDNF